jgi:GAF domain-containing protein
MLTRDPFIAIDAGTDVRAHARSLRRVWEGTLEGGGSAVRPRAVIEQSWARMKRAGLDPERLKPGRALDADALAQARHDSPIADLLPVLRRCLGALADDAQHVMVICDEAGRILWLEGHPRVKEDAVERIEFTEGMLWTEDSAGTNAIGTALEIDHAVQVFSAEHFLADQHAWWCSAAPIHDPATGALLGVVDISGPLRTAHPHSLGLVSAAAGMAEDALRFRRAADEDRMRQAYLERTARLGRHRSAMIDRDGRVLIAHPAGWVAGAVALPGDGGVITLPDGRQALAEPLEDGGHLLWGVTGRSASARTALRLELCGRQALSARVGSARPISLGVRQGEILALLALHPDGLTCEQLTLELYGDGGNPVSTRAQMSKLRRLFGPVLAARPYRLLADVTADFLEVERLLLAGDVHGALRAYRAPLLVESEVPRIVQARDELEGALRRAARMGGADTFWRWLETESGRDDLAGLRSFVSEAAPDDPRASIAVARLRALRRRWA